MTDPADPNFRVPNDDTGICGTGLRHRRVVVVVEYVAGETRVRKEFTAAPAARRFYLQMDAAGAEPRIVYARNA